MMLIVLFRKRGKEGKELKAPRYASAAATRDYITARDIIPNIYFIYIPSPIIKVEVLCTSPYVNQQQF